MKKENKSSTEPDAKPMLPAVPSSVVYNENCVEALKRFDDNYFDVAIVDPPYGLNVSALSNYGESGGTDKRWNTSKKDFYKPKDWDKATPTAEYWITFQGCPRHHFQRFLELMEFLVFQRLVSV